MHVVDGSGSRVSTALVGNAVTGSSAITGRVTACGEGGILCVDSNESEGEDGNDVLVHFKFISLNYKTIR